MKNKNKSKERFIANFSILFATCCTNLSVEDATRKMNSTQPTGISSKWQLADKDQLPEALSENPWQCEDDPAWKHMYFIC